MNTTLLNWVIIPILIFFARICDVSIGTVRIILVSRGKKLLASSLGFVEVIIWLLAVSQAMQHINNVACVIAYGLGFATGTYVGITIEEKLAIGLQALRFITKNTLDVLTMALRDEGYGATVIEAKGGKGKVNIIFTIVPRKDVNKTLEIAKEFDPDVFVSIQDIRSVKSGVFPFKTNGSKWRKVVKKK
jgi:uncharacterized protein YebE (UPF0316 family)